MICEPTNALRPRLIEVERQDGYPPAGEPDVRENCEIAYVNVLDFIASSRQAWIGKVTPKLPDKTVSVDFDGWAFPRSGVAFVWVLEADLDSSYRNQAV